MGLFNLKWREQFKDLFRVESAMNMEGVYQEPYSVTYQIIYLDKNFYKFVLEDPVLKYLHTPIPIKMMLDQYPKLINGEVCKTKFDKKYEANKFQKRLDWNVYQEFCRTIQNYHKINKEYRNWLISQN